MISAGGTGSAKPTLLHERRLFRPAAQVIDRALLAQRALGLADVAAVQDQPVVGMQAKRRRHDLFELELDLERRLARRHSGAVADAENMGVDGEGLLAECDVEDDVGGLAADAGQRLQHRARSGHFAAVLGDELVGRAMRSPPWCCRAMVLMVPRCFARERHLFRRIDLRERAGSPC
jgi:hypothetical protein